MADKTVTPSEAAKPLDEATRNKGHQVKGYDEKNPDPKDIHSDDPLVAGLANGERQAEGKGDEAPIVQ